MTRLLTHAPDDQAEAPSFDTKFGGLPSAPPNTLTWPVCRSCKGNMQFLGQIQPANEEENPTQLLLLFMCQNNPGICQEWDPNLGANQVVPVAISNLILIPAPPSGETTRPARYAAKVISHEDPDYDNARSNWASTNNLSPRQVLGQLRGTPSWIQGDETPVCDSCHQPMRFIAQLEQGPDANSEMNFGGGGCAYVFQCPTCPAKNANILWQC